MVAAQLSNNGYAVFAADPQVAAWAGAAAEVAGAMPLTPRRHGGTWFVGVDALPNTPDGAVAGVPLAGAWQAHVTWPDTWHRAQLSVVFPGYPGRDPQESDAAHRYRRDRDAAHMDGLLPEGPQKRRHLREPHGFILGLPLNDVVASPLVVWDGSHRVMAAAFARAFAGTEPAQWGDMDVTDIYQSARRAVFATCTRRAVTARPGQAILLHRHLIHGVAPWAEDGGATPRMVAYFRPLIAPSDWLSADTF